MILHDQNIKYLTFKSLDDLKIVRHCFPTRIGGISKPPYNNLNLSFSSGDSKGNVITNFGLISDEVGFDKDDIVIYRQVHGAKIHHVTKENAKGLLVENDIKDIDGLITNVPGIVLATSHADCVPLYFVDPVKKVIGLSHSGWKGTVLEIGKKTINEMVDKYGCNSSDIFAAIGPSICGDCFLVDFPVFKEFENKFSYINDFTVFDSVNNKYKIDLWGINKKMISETGIKIENIEVTDYCTKCNPDLFYSHRSMGNKRGGHVAFLELLDIKYI